MEQALGRGETRLNWDLLCLHPGPQSQGIGTEGYRYAGTYGHRHPGVDGQARQRYIQTWLPAYLGLLLPQTPWEHQMDPAVQPPIPQSSLLTQPCSDFQGPCQMGCVYTLSREG